MISNKDDAEEYATRAKNAVNSGDYDSAISDIEKAIKASPRSVPYHLIKADALYRKGDYESALDVLNFAENIEKNNPEIHSLKSICYGSMGKFNDSKTEAAKAIKADPSYPFAYYNRAKAEQYLEEYDLAKKDLQKYLEMQPNDPDAYLDLADMEYHEGDYKKALQNVNTAIKKDKENTDAHDLKLNILLAQKDIESYLKELLEAFKDTEDFKYVGTLVETLKSVGSFDTAEDILKEFIKIYKEEPFLYDALARVYYDQNRKDDAYKTYEDLLKANADREAKIYWFDFLLDDGSYDRLIDEIDKSGLKDDEVLEIKYLAEDQKGDHNAALHTAEELMELDRTPYNVSLYGSQLRKLGKIDESIKAMSEFDEDPDVAYELFLSYMDRDDVGSASRYLKIAIENSEDDEDIISNVLEGVSKLMDNSDFQSVNSFLDGLDKENDDLSILTDAMHAINSGVFEGYEKGKEKLLGIDEHREEVCEFVNNIVQLTEGKAKVFLEKFIEENCSEEDEED
ncbi:lipopolysaccharide assembly protein LapB [Thermoplasma sp.]|uniref:tetratricopeptide repeat protein n=1 Tax=Thermoplasma sp. TaxID=1973142 RepID=UPI0012868527|nr:tetratricopeptide repeat protein [Thermoplasma sp.]KAA8922294.1 MAG: tetratricopeptide repeat protein [Thermoplasma sp.]